MESSVVNQRENQCLSLSDQFNCPIYGPMGSWIDDISCNVLSGVGRGVQTSGDFAQASVSLARTDLYVFKLQKM